MRAAVPFVLCFDSDPSFSAGPLPFCHVKGFKKDGLIYWGIDEASFRLPSGTPVSGSFEDARAYFIATSCCDPAVKLIHVF